MRTEVEYNTFEKRAAARSIISEYLARYGPFKRGKQIISLCGFQHEIDSTTRIFYDSGADPGDMVGIDDSVGHIERCRAEWPKCDWRAGLWADEFEALSQEAGFNPCIVHYDAMCVPEGKQAEVMYEDLASSMKASPTDTMMVVTVALKRAGPGAHWDGMRGDKNVRGEGRMQFIESLRVRLGQKESDAWGLNAKPGDISEPLVGLYKQHGHRVPMAVYVFFKNYAANRLRNESPAPLKPPASPEEFEALNRSIPTVSEFFKPLHTLTVRPKRQKPAPWKHQKRIRRKIKELLRSDGTSKVLFTVPCGGGKTRSEAEAIADAILLTKSPLVAIMCPRRDLARQLSKEFNRLREDGINLRIIAVNSGGRYELPTFEGDEEGGIYPDTDVEEIRRYVTSATPECPTVFFCLYQSSEVLREALGNRKLGLLVCDEAHFLTNERCHGIIDPASEYYVPFEKLACFTATKRIDPSVPERSMDNPLKYGEIDATTPKELFEQGLIVMPQLKLLQVCAPPSMEAHEEYAEAISSVYAVVDRLRAETESRLLVFCNNAYEQPEKFLRNELLRRSFPGHFMAFITADHCYYREPGPYGLVRRADRDTIYNAVPAYRRSILFHYDCVSVGIDVPNLTDVLFLRNDVGEETLIQGIGRVLRASPGKEYGRVWLTLKSGTHDDLKDKFRGYVRALHTNEFQYNVNDITTIFNGKSTLQKKSGKLFSEEDPNSLVSEKVILEIVAAILADSQKEFARQKAYVPFDMTPKRIRQVRQRLNMRPPKKAAGWKIQTCRECSKRFSFWHNNVGRYPLLCTGPDGCRTHEPLTEAERKEIQKRAGKKASITRRRNARRKAGRKR